MMGGRTILLVPTCGFWGQSPLEGKILVTNSLGTYVAYYVLRGMKIVLVTQIIRDTSFRFILNLGDTTTQKLQKN